MYAKSRPFLATNVKSEEARVTNFLVHGTSKRSDRE